MLQVSMKKKIIKTMKIITHATDVVIRMAFGRDERRKKEKEKKKRKSTTGTRDTKRESNSHNYPVSCHFVSQLYPPSCNYTALGISTKERFSDFAPFFLE